MFKTIKNMTVKKQLLNGFGGVCILMVIISIASIVEMRFISKDINNIVDDRWPKTVWANDIADNVNLNARALRNMILTEDRKEIDKQLDRIKEADKVIKERMENLHKTVASEKGKEILKALEDSEAAYHSELNVELKLIEGGKKELAIKHLFTTLRLVQATYFKAIDEMIKYQGSLMVKSGNDAAQNVTNMIILSLILTAAGILLAVVTSLWIVRSITKPINEAVVLTTRVAEGDLTVNLEAGSTNEIGQLITSIKNMVEKLKTIISDLTSSSTNMASSSYELSASSEQMSRGVTEQSDRALQIATASNELSQTIVDVAKNASNIATSATETAKAAKEGELIVIKSIQEVKAIADTVNDSAKLMISLGERSKQIGDIVSVIKDIADQTNLLALNAAIEAARAGEQGRGFAVVADEVRKLAERTAKATSEIGAMISAIQEETGKAVASMEYGTKRVEVGVEFSAKAGEALRRIVGSIDELQSMVQQIAAATEEMSTASEQIGGAIEAIATVSKETSSSSGQIAQSSSDLARLATNLKGVVQQFKV
jgi:methyl-accepting chemotaxis protein